MLEKVPGGRVAFFGGSFDPPHLGHIAVARAARNALSLDRVLFAPVGRQPLKRAGASASFEDRVAMVRLAIAGEAGFAMSLADAPVPGRDTPNYTYDTLAELRRTLPAGTQLFLLVGADSLRTLRYWHRAAELLFLANLIVAARPGEALGEVSEWLPPGVSGEALDGAPDRYRLWNAAGGAAEATVLPNLHYEVSATALRAAIGGNAGSGPEQISPPVLDYIRERQLYRYGSDRRSP